MMLIGVFLSSVCGITDDDADDYENVIDNRKEPAVPERAKKGNQTTGKREDMQLKCKIFTYIHQILRQDYIARNNTLYQVSYTNVSSVLASVLATAYDCGTTATNSSRSLLQLYLSVMGKPAKRNPGNRAENTIHGKNIHFYYTRTMLY